MTQAPKKRAWFQIHLSTAVVLMFAAGGLFWINVYTQYFTYHTCNGASRYLPDQAIRERFSDYDAELDQLGTVRFNHKQIGWPRPCFRYIVAGFGHFNRQLQFVQTSSWRGYVESDFDLNAALLDVAVIVMLLLLVCVLCEVRIRWRDQREHLARILRDACAAEMNRSKN